MSDNNNEIKNQNAIVKGNNSNITGIDLFNDKDLIVAETLIKKLMSSSKSGIKSVQDGLAMIVWAKDLNLPLTTIVNHMHTINDRPGFDIHIVRALLLKAGCVWEKVKDYQPQYEYTDSINVYNGGLLPDYAIRCNSKEEADKKFNANPNSDNVFVYPVKYYADFNGHIYKDYQLNATKFKIIVNKTQAVECAKSGIIGVYRIPAVPIDYVTEYKFTRMINGKEMIIHSSFSLSNATTANLIKDGGVYQKYPQIMIATRAFTYGAREIADDVLNGITEYTELKDIEGKVITENDVIDITNESI